MSDNRGRNINEPSMAVALNMAGEIEAGNKLRIETGEANVTADSDELLIRLLERIPDVQSLQSGRASARMIASATCVSPDDCALGIVDPATRSTRNPASPTFATGF